MGGVMEEDEKITPLDFIQWAAAVGLGIGLFMFALALPFLLLIGIVEGIKAL